MTRTLFYLCILIIVLAAVASGIGALWQGTGQPVPFTTSRGETVLLQGHGLYRYDSVAGAAQTIAQDTITLLVGLPLLVCAMLLCRRGLLRGKLLLTGALGYFLYTFMSMAFGVAYNSLFLVYVVLFTSSLVAFILSLSSIDIANLPAHFSPALPRRGLAFFSFLTGGFLLTSWLGRIVTGLVNNVPPFGLESYSTLFVQVMDLGLIVPLAFVSGILLWQGRRWGYVLTCISLILGFAMLVAVSAMAIGQVMAGVPINMGELIMFPTLTLIAVVMNVLLVKNVRETAEPAYQPTGTVLSTARQIPYEKR